MVDSSKILTVSYGTFSCTLEGFDDSFGTMKAIAEYFRDLAADDRYFGAEPPAPDAHMLAKIAEREITRRVDARTEDGGIVLRAQERPAPAMPPQSAPPSERADPVKVAAAAVAPQVLDTDNSTSHIDDAFEMAQSDATASDLAPVAGPEAEEKQSSPLVVSGQAASEMAAPDADPADSMNHPDAESIAAKLQRIRAVVGNDQPATNTDFAEDQHAIQMPDIADEAPAIDIADDTEIDMEDLARLDGAPIDFDGTYDDDDDADSDAPLAQTVADVTEAADTIDDTAQNVADDAASADISALMADDDPDLAATDGTEDIAMPAVDHADTAADAAPAADDDDASILESLSQQMADTTPADDAVADTDEKPVIRAQVMRLRKADLAAPAAAADAIADTMGDAETGQDIDTPAVDTLDDIAEYDIKPTSGETSLSPAEEADLMEELAEVERDFAPAPEIEPEAEAEADPQPEAEPEATAKPRNSLPETDDATMSHLLDQTDQQLNEPEGNRRRNAIAQLKAAVAATEAARQLGDNSDAKAEAEDAFRGDLNEAVRPSRPARVKPQTVRTERPRPAPLKLVASQRIDTTPAQSDATVAPRRVATLDADVDPSSASNFAEFAEDMGANNLADLLEAAAAYTAFVEGSEDFSRPQIMKKVQSSSDVAFSREDGLRSFGTLLREGRISKVRNGRFQVSDETRFRPTSIAG